MTETAGEDWRGLALHGPDGKWIGQIAEVYDADQVSSGMPTLAAVRTGLLGLRASFVPLWSVAERAGDRVLVPFDVELVKSAPSAAQADDLTPGDVAEIFRHYDLEGPSDLGRDSLGRHRLIRRQVTVAVVSATDVEALSEALPPELSPEDVPLDADSGKPVVIVVREKDVESANLNGDARNDTKPS